MKNAAQTTRGKFSREALPPAIPYYASQGIELTGSGQWLKAICPFHNDTNPSLNVKVNNGAYRCFVCNAKGGDILDFHQQRHNLNFVQACRELGAWVEGSKLTINQMKKRPTHTPMKLAMYYLQKSAM
jgi:DNA primase